MSHVHLTFQRQKIQIEGKEKPMQKISIVF